MIIFALAALVLIVTLVQKLAAMLIGEEIQQLIVPEALVMLLQRAVIMMELVKQGIARLMLTALTIAARVIVRVVLVMERHLPVLRIVRVMLLVAAIIAVVLLQVVTE